MQLLKDGLAVGAIEAQSTRVAEQSWYLRCQKKSPPELKGNLDKAVDTNHSRDGGQACYLPYKPPVSPYSNPMGAIRPYPHPRHKPICLHKLPMIKGKGSGLTPEHLT